MHVLSDYAVIVPSLHPSREHILPFLEELITMAPGAIVLVDDGSGEDYRTVFETAEKMGCIVLRHSENRGKGRALKTAFQHYSEHLSHLRGAITADSDGQHDAADIAKVGRRLHELNRSGSPTVVFGSRPFDGPGIPRKSRFGNTLTSKVVGVLFGRHVMDTQTGLRGLPREIVAPATAVRGEGFEYEMNQLMWLLASRQSVDEVTIRTIYHDSSNSITHFRPVLDSLRIYATIFRQMFSFAGVSILSAAVDLATYYILIDFVFGADRTSGHVAAAVALARIGSSLLNYVLNRTVVFRHARPPQRAMHRYYALAAGLLLASSAGTTLLSVLTGGHDMWAKIGCDLVLFIVSYVVQRRWVFATPPAAVLAHATTAPDTYR